LKDIALPPVGEAERSPAVLDEKGFSTRKVADKAVQAYFHQYEIVVTFPKSLQAVFMHMKEAD
jgi:hypothetical protein